MKKLLLTFLGFVCCTLSVAAQQPPASSENLLFLIDGKLVLREEAAKINKESIESLTVIKQKKHKELFGINDDKDLIIVITKAKKNSPENLTIEEKISKINFKSESDAGTKPKTNPPSRDSIPNGVFDFISMEKQPQFPGGIKAFYDYLNANIKYPKEARKNHISGRVFLSFIVEKDGQLTNIKVTRG
ncbi:TonB family protein [Pedobacter chinensis]|uniref:TonB family protein n=1 Tax=Pedobacter chinensis TaxID=2282421 RepID=A0A369Q129_9SPHI|nr:TonB family protein [Pedobacter chinensis]RDC57175.1 TonB family protein [Pedobacter chinensis]